MFLANLNKSFLIIGLHVPYILDLCWSCVREECILVVWKQFDTDIFNITHVVHRAAVRLFVYLSTCLPVYLPVAASEFID